MRYDPEVVRCFVDVIEEEIRSGETAQRPEICTVQRLTGSTVSADILLVDDDPKVLEIVSVSLARQGYRVRTAPRVARRLAHAAGSAPHLLILGHRTPRHERHRRARWIRDDHETLPVLVLSAQNDVDSRVARWTAERMNSSTSRSR